MVMFSVNTVAFGCFVYQSMLISALKLIGAHVYKVNMAMTLLPEVLLPPEI